MKNKKIKRLTLYLATWVIGMLTLDACSAYYFRSNYQDANMLLHATDNIHTKPYLKAHLKNGDVCILKDTWQADTLQHLVSGKGSRYDFNRKKIAEGELSIPIDSVAIFETNKKLNEVEETRIFGLSLLAGLDVALGVVCLTVPKACFGSCPTFYIHEENHFHYADAEGFSNAISPSMEYFDIDALNNPPIAGDTFSLTMKNEALETHCVNDVRLWAFPRKDGERVYQSPNNDFYLCEHSYPLSQARGAEGDITSLLRSADRQEWFSLADAHNMSSKEEIYLTFDNIEHTQDLGLIVSFRQTLMTTYLIYSAIGYMGDEVGDIFAKMETDKQTNEKLKNGIKKELGNIAIYVWNGKEKIWELQDGFYETGPIAFNHQILPLTTPVSGAEIRMKIVLNKGLWRLDYLGLTHIKGKVEPIEIRPNEILNKGKIDPTALAQINALDQYLLSMPGSEYRFNFILPGEHPDYELFLYAKGYYLEWMRAAWLKDKDLLKLKQMIDHPRKYLQVEAPTYKEYEQSMEQEFWNSKIDTKTFSYYEP